MTKKIFALIIGMFILSNCSILPTRIVPVSNTYTSFSWENMPSDWRQGKSRDVIIENRDIFKLLNPQEKLCVDLILSKNDFIELTPEQAQLLVGYTYIPPENKKIFLFRTIGGYGIDYIARRGDDLYISHGAMGAAGDTFHKSALIIHLDFTPQKLYLGALSVN